MVNQELVNSMIAFAITIFVIVIIIMIIKYRSEREPDMEPPDRQVINI